MRSAILLLLLVGCGSSETNTPAADAASADTTSTSDTATATDTSAATDAAGQEKLICDALASRTACAGGAVDCTPDVKCIYGRLMLSAAASAWAMCRSAPSCKGDDECVRAAGKAVGGAAADKYETDCTARLTACPSAFKDDFCSAGIFAYASAGTAAVACITKACDQIAMCLGNIQAIKDIAACK